MPDLGLIARKPGPRTDRAVFRRLGVVLPDDGGARIWCCRAVGGVRHAVSEIPDPLAAYSETLATTMIGSCSRRLGLCLVR